jgi:hypothetical protein
MVSINQLRVDRRRVRQQPQPAKRPDAFILFKNVCGMLCRETPVKTIATGDKITLKAAVFPPLTKETDGRSLFAS